MKSYVIKKRAKNNRCRKIDKLQSFAVFFFYRSMKGRDRYRLDPIHYQKYAVYCTLPFYFTVCADCLKCHISTSFSEEMFGLLEIIFVCRSFLGVRHSKNIQKSYITIFGLVLC